MSVTLNIAGQTYRRWTSVSIKRGLKQVCSQFSLETPAELSPAIVPFQPCSVSDDGDLLLTGYIVSVAIDVDAQTSKARITGQSKTQDLVDCMPEFGTNQFDGSTLDAIARTIAAAFGIGVVIGAGVDVGDPFPVTRFKRDETGFAFLERLARQRAVLLTDDAAGNLVLATAGTARAPASLAMGKSGNVARSQGRLNGKGRFSKYTILSQAGISLTGSDVQTDVEAVANDGGVPRYRPWSGLAETASLVGDAQKRANWEAAHRSGQAVQATFTVPEWRANGILWQQNQLVHCTAPRLSIAGDFLIGEIEYQEDMSGRKVLLTVAPPSAYMPQPPVTTVGGTWAGIDPVVGAKTGAL